MVTLIGRTGNAKLGAVIILEDSSVVYLQGMNSWPDKYNRKPKFVSVTGVMSSSETLEKSHKVLNPDKTMYHADASGELLIIHGFSWRVVKRKNKSKK